MKKILFLSIVALILATNPLVAQQPALVINKTTPGPVTGGVCPLAVTNYSLIIRSDYQSCGISWSASGGTIQSQNSTSVSVKWDDSPGTICTLTASAACPSSGPSITRSELIMSIKDISWGTYNNSITVDFCNQDVVNVSVPRMFVPGTGGVAQPALTEVIYGWTLPAGWKEAITGKTGFIAKSVHFIAIEPINCSAAGNITIQGFYNDASMCANGAPSSTATVSLVAPKPVITVVPESSFTGSHACDTNPVNFYAEISGPANCIPGSYNWTIPASWTYVSQSGNMITLQPTGGPSDAQAIKVAVTLSCGSAVTSANYVPPFRPPYISGSHNVCADGAYLTLVDGGPNSISWSNSANLSLNSGQGTTTIHVSPYDGSAREPGSIDATLTSCPQIPVPTKPVWLGLPNPIVDILKGSGVIAIGATVPFSIHDPNNYYAGVVTYDWDVGGGYFSWIDSYAWITITEPYLVVYAGSRNVCGSLGMTSRGWNTENPSGCPPGQICEVRMGPNPASDEIVVSFPKLQKQPLKGNNILLRNSNGTIVYRASQESNGGDMRIDVRNYKNGIYFLSYSENGKSKQMRIMINH